jgi:hypothetical protein
MTHGKGTRVPLQNKAKAQSAMKLDRDQRARDQAGEEYEHGLKNEAMEQKEGAGDQYRVSGECARKAGIHYGNSL